MSCVAAIVNDGKIWMAADGLASTEDGCIRPANCTKIFTNGDYTIGFIGSVRGGQILYPKYFAPPEDIMDLPDAIKEQCELKGCLAYTEQQTHVMGSNYLVGYRGKLYEILVDFQMVEVPDYSSIGSGSYYAYASLFTTKDMVDIGPEKRLEYAIKSAIEYDAACGLPIQMVRIMPEKN